MIGGRSGSVTSEEMKVDLSTGLVFPAGPDQRRSTSALGRAVVADALGGLDAIGSGSARAETNWRRGYLIHFRRLIEAGLSSGDAARTIARDGLASLYQRMRFIRPGGTEVGLSEIFDGTASGSPEDGATSGSLETVTISGTGGVDRELSLPYRGQRLRGDALIRQLDTWVQAGTMEPSAATAVRAVATSPDWLDLSDQRIVVLGAGAEMGPIRSLLRWGASVVAVDLPRPPIWTWLLDHNARFGGQLCLPARPGTGDLADRAGADLLHDLPEVAQWLLGLDGRLVLGNYVYADGATNVRVSMAVDVLGEHIRARRPDTALAFLATPTDVFAVPGTAVAHAEQAYRRRTTLARLRGPLRVLSAGRLLRRNYAPGVDPGICDSLVPQQGPNYALAKRLQRWRATVARHDGALVSFKVAPPTRTRSVLRNRALAAAYAGAHLFDVEVFEPATSNTLMAILLVHDLRNPPVARPYSWQDEADGAVHGGLWRAPYAPRSALGLAALVGLGGART